MKDDETGAIALSSRFVFVAYLVLWLPLAVNGHSCPDGVQGSPFGDSWSSFYGQRRSRGCHGLGDICPASGSFCFPSTLLGFFSEGDGEQLPALELSNGSGKTMRNATLRMLNGGHVSCSLMNSIYETVGRTNGNRSIRADGVDFCGGLLVPDIWSRASNVPSKDLEDVSHGADGGLLGSSSLPEIELSPPLLDWGTKNLYSPSLAILKVVNKHKEHVLNIYDPFSTNSQFFAYDFQELLLAPGESASIPFIFLPRLLGFSSAQIVLQTTFGGFIIDAKGVGTSSPYHLQTLEGLNICVGERMSRKLSLYNPCPDELFVKEVTTSVSIYGSKQNHSTYVVCKSDTCHQSGIDLDSVLESTWFSLGDFGLFTFDIRPYEQWEIPPHSAKAVVELKFWSSLARKVSGAICLKLSTSKEGSDTTVIVPLDIEVQEMNDFTDLKGFVSLSFETLIPCQGRRSVFSISLRNDASNVLHVVKIVEETANRHKLFKIKYKEGLLLFPGTVTRIALLTYTSHYDLQNTVTEVSHAGLNCMLAIMTNDSSNPEMSIPCHALVRNSCIYQPGHNSESQGAYSKLTSIEEKKKLKSTMASSVGNIVEISSSFKDADDLILLNWRSQATASEMSVLEDEELLFPVVLVGSHYSKWISVHNPSQKPVVMQLLLNSAVITDQCKFNDDYLEHTFLSKYSHIDSAEISVGFSIAESAITEAIVHPLESALFGPIIFRPSNRCMWKSSALIRNNLSGVEWLRLQAFGGFQSLALLEGSKPFLKLDFELSIPATFNVSSSANTFIHDDSSSPCCNNVLSKELYAKNTGDLPLEVIKLKVSGTDCSSNGFVIHSCKGFTLAPGESAQLLISYQPDFSTSVVHRDLELAMANGILVIPMKASIPICMLNLCKKAAFRSGLWKLLLMMLFVSFLLLLFMFRIIPQPFSPAADDYFPKLKDSMASIGKAATSSRLAECTRYTRISTEDEKSDCSDVLHDNSKRHGTLSNRAMEITKNCHTLESPQSNLTIRVVRDKGRRRKRRTTGAGLAAKFDVSSSQSGNSTPSSPLSSNTSTPKQILSQSPPVDQPCVEEIEEHSSRYEQDVGISSELKKPESAKCCNNEWPSSDLCLSPLITNTSRKPSLLQSATFPGPGWRIPGAGDSSFLALMSPIAPHARAPGSKLCRDENTKGERNDVIGKHFTYDIWGNHFSDCTFRMPKGSISTLSDASEGGSQSFFSRDPQSLMMMPSAQPVSPGLELLPSFDVDRLDEMN